MKSNDGERKEELLMKVSNILTVMTVKTVNSAYITKDGERGMGVPSAIAMLMASRLVMSAITQEIAQNSKGIEALGLMAMTGQLTEHITEYIEAVLSTLKHADLESLEALVDTYKEHSTNEDPNAQNHMGSFGFPFPPSSMN